MTVLAETRTVTPDKLLDYITTLLSQFAGGPGPAENNLVRFGLAATFWAVLLFFAWNRQRQQDLPRERLLMLGFGLGFLRDAFMFVHLSFRLVTGTEHDALCAITVPLEHALTLVSMVIIGAAFLRYMLEDDALTTRYLRTGVGVASVGLLAMLLWWPQQIVRNPAVRFHATWPALLIHIIAAVMLILAIGILIRARGWLRNIVVVSLSFFFMAEALVIFNLATQRVFKELVCPLGNTLYILAIPLFGYVYFREQANEKRQVETALAAYRDHLEELVDERTAALTAATKQLEWAAALEERQRIAADMHDGLAQTLSYLGLKTDVVQDMLEEGEVGRAHGAVDEIRGAVKQAIGDVRQSIASLQSAPKPQASLQDLLTRVAAEAGPTSGAQVRTRLAVAAPLYLPGNQTEQLLRIVQEALGNAQRHAQATVITLSLVVEDEQATLTIADDGQGFAQEDLAVMADNHFGLSIMSARARRMGGRLEVASQPGEGTRVTLSWPLVAATGASEEVQGQGSHHEQDTRPPGRRSQSLP